jgi:DsbC/DsbD-like thiol-disulfide interchange protein
MFTALEPTETSAWDGSASSKVRLIAGGVDKTRTNVMRAGIEISLGPGWKTYWRYPGDSGVPPRFDFSRSENVAKVEVLWPAPHVLSDESGHSIGYKDNVIFPLHVTAREPGKPSLLRLDLDYAVCERLCIPAQAKVELALPGPADDPVLAASEARVPKPAAIGQAGALAITTVRQETGTRARVVVDVTAPSGAAVELFAEGPTPDWALPVPELVTGAPAGVQRFAFDIDGVPPGASAKGALLKLTAASADAAIEVTARLD